MVFTCSATRESESNASASRRTERVVRSPSGRSERVLSSICAKSPWALDVNARIFVS